MSTTSTSQSTIGQMMLMRRGGGITYLLRDLFTTDRAAGSVDGTDAEPGVASRDVTDIENKIFTESGRLRGGGQDSPVWGESSISWTADGVSGYARATGRVLAALIVPEDTIVDANIAFGFATAINIVDPRTDGLGWYLDTSGELKIITPGLTVLPQTTAADTRVNVFAMQYLIVIALNDQGAYIMASTFGTSTLAKTARSTPQYPLARIIWFDDADATAEFFPYISYYGKIDGPAAGYPNGNSIEDVRLLDIADWDKSNFLATFSDRFDRADSDTELGNGWTTTSGSVWGITGGKAYLVEPASSGNYGAIHDTGLTSSDGIYQWNVTMADAIAGQWSCLFRYQDDDNFFKICNNGTTNTIYLYRRLAGVDTNIVSTGAGITWTFGQTYRIVLFVEDGRFSVFVDNIRKLTPASAYTDLDTVTNIGIRIFYNKFSGGDEEGPTGFRFDDVIATPLTVTLPTEISAGKTPTILTGGSVLAQDSFTDSDTTNLESHTPESGGAWSAGGSAVWQITGNQADPVTPTTGDLQITQSISTANAEAQVDIAIPNPFAVSEYFLAGICFRYVDENNFIVARVTHVPYAATSDEVELFCYINGVSKFYHKAHLGDYNNEGETKTLKVQAYNDLIQVFLNGSPIISYYTESDDPMGTRWGLHVDRRTGEVGDEGALFNDWIVKSL